MTTASEASRSFDKKEEELLQLRQDVFEEARAAAERLQGDWPKNSHPHYTNPRLVPVCHINREQVFLGEDGSVQITVTDDSIHYPRPTDLADFARQQLTDLKQLFKHM